MSEPIPSQISPSLRSEDVARPLSGLAPMDQYLPRSVSLSLGESTDSPFLLAPRTPRRIIEELVSGSVVGSPSGELPVTVAQPSMPDLSREGPFDVHRDYSTSWPALPPVVSASRPLSSSGIPESRPTRFHFGRAPFRGSI